MIKKGDEILLTRNSYQYVWTLPGGFLTKGESFNKAVEREIKEELGLKVIIERVLEVKSIKKRPVIDVFLLCHYKGGEISPDLVEVEKAKFFPVDQLPKNTFIQHQKLIKKYKMI